MVRDCKQEERRPTIASASKEAAYCKNLYFLSDFCPRTQAENPRARENPRRARRTEAGTGIGKHCKTMLPRSCVAVLLCIVATCEAAPVQNFAAHNFTDCGSTVLIPTSVSLTPDPPVKGSKWAIGFTAKPTRPITNGTLDVIVKIWGFPISHKLDICYGGDGWPGCPFDGPINITDWNPAIPRFGPSGPFEGTFNITDSNGDILMCLQTQWKQT